MPNRKQEEQGLMAKKATSVKTTPMKGAPLELDRFHTPDPLMTVAETSMTDAHELRSMNVSGVADWFCKQGLEDVAGVVIQEKLSGTLLAAMGEHDLKDVFPHIGTRKAMIVLISRLKTATRSLARNTKMWSGKEDRPSQYKLKVHNNFCGFNCCLGLEKLSPHAGKKDKKAGLCCCQHSAVVNTVTLPVETYSLYSARLSVTSAKWKDISDEHPDMHLKSRDYVIAKQAMPQYQLMTDNIDTSLINDVDTVQNVLNKPPNPKPPCFGCCGRLTWEGGHEIGVVRVSYEEKGGNGIGSRTIDLQVPAGETQTIADLVMNAMEEAQMEDHGHVELHV